MAIARKTTSKPFGISKTVRDFGSLTRESEGVRGRPRIVLAARTPRPLPEPRVEPAAPKHEGDVSLDALVREWLLELKAMGRSPRTILTPHLTPYLTPLLELITNGLGLRGGFQIFE